MHVAVRSVFDTVDFSLMVLMFCNLCKVRNEKVGVPETFKHIEQLCVCSEAVTLHGCWHERSVDEHQPNYLHT